MGANLSRSTRAIPDYVYVVTHVDDTGYVKVRFFVWNVENALKATMYMREHDELSRIA